MGQNRAKQAKWGQPGPNGVKQGKTRSIGAKGSKTVPRMVTILEIDTEPNGAKHGQGWLNGAKQSQTRQTGAKVGKRGQNEVKWGQTEPNRINRG